MRAAPIRAPMLAAVNAEYQDWNGVRTMKRRELENLGVPTALIKTAQETCGRAAALHLHKPDIRASIASVVADPNAFLDDPVFCELARELIEAARQPQRYFTPRSEPAPWKQWGANLEPQSVQQLENACQLPIAVAGALMPDAHLGYGLPIGGVLATDNAVIPYAVGVDIACRMRMSVYDLPARTIKSEPDRLINALEKETRFGIGANFRNRREHQVMDEDWSVTTVTQTRKDKAWSQLGSSGSGNHFVEYGVLTLTEPDLGLEPGEYLALLSHSGSRGVGAAVAGHYSKLAMSMHPDLPKPLRHLAWLDLDTAEGQEYWAAMNLMGEYAAANHACIHRHIAKALKADVIADVENHHNFAWVETHEHLNDGRSVIVHRKGATPAGEDVLGIIPGSMATPAYVVRGKGSSESIESAAHGAGRLMSRTEAKRTFTWSQANKFLADREVQLLSAGLDEVPMVYKDIDRVMSEQEDLVRSVARFDPKIVKMAPPGERPED